MVKRFVILGLVVLSCASGGGTTAFAQPQEFHYIKKESREASREATLAQYLPQLDWSSWHLIGPFDNTAQDKHGVVYPPELGVSLDRTYRGKDRARVSWQQISQLGWGPITLERFEPDEANLDAMAYVYREVVADRDGDVTFEIGSDDGSWAVPDRKGGRCLEGSVAVAQQHGHIIAA